MKAPYHMAVGFPMALLAGCFLTPAEGRPLPFSDEMLPSFIQDGQRGLPLPQPVCVDALDPSGMCGSLFQNQGYCRAVTILDARGSPWHVYDCRFETNPLAP